MSEQHIKIATLNLQHFVNWETRLPLICSLLKRLDPDIILLQEVQKDSSYGQNDQATLLAEKLGYPHVHFEVACLKTARKGVPLPYPVEHGLGILSKKSFDVEAIKLTQSDGKEERIILNAYFKNAAVSFVVTNVHFTNTDSGAEVQFKETVKLLEAQNIRPIIAGDFNIKNLAQYQDIYKKEYISSTDVFSYVSYPENNLSYDYMLLPREYSFASFICCDEPVSDHRLLFVSVSLN